MEYFVNKGLGKVQDESWVPIRQLVKEAFHIDIEPLKKTYFRR
jgi:hypothetical protein